MWKYNVLAGGPHFATSMAGDRDLGCPIFRALGEKWGPGLRQRARTPAKRLSFNVWTERKRIEKLRYMHRNPVKRSLVGRTRAVALEQFSLLRVRRDRRGARERLASAEGEDPHGVTNPLPRCPLLAQNARNGAPQILS